MARLLRGCWFALQVDRPATCEREGRNTNQWRTHTVGQLVAILTATIHGDSPSTYEHASATSQAQHGSLTNFPFTTIGTHIVYTNTGAHRTRTLDHGQTLTLPMLMVVDFLSACSVRVRRWVRKCRVHVSANQNTKWRRGIHFSTS